MKQHQTAIADMVYFTCFRSIQIAWQSFTSDLAFSRHRSNSFYPVTFYVTDHEYSNMRSSTSTKVIDGPTKIAFLMSSVMNQWCNA
jgi:hypothetical protein